MQNATPGTLIYFYRYHPCLAKTKGGENGVAENFIDLIRVAKMGLAKYFKICQVEIRSNEKRSEKV